MQKNKKIIWIIVAIIIIIGIVYFILKNHSNSNQTSGMYNNNQAPMENGQNNTPPTNPAGTPASSGGFGMKNIPAGSKAFFGTIASNNGTTITLTSRGMRSRTAGGTTTAPATTTMTITVNGATQISGGDASALIQGTRITGYGTLNNDGSITATQISINPQMPAGMHRQPTNTSQTQ
ncbi:MAG: DUF5666 domain-containing protein [Minisyncoccia bacterium]